MQLNQTKNPKIKANRYVIKPQYAKEKYMPISL